MKRVLKAEHLSKRYRSLQAVDDVSLRLESGEAVGLLGPNGAGKTTIFRMLAGLIFPGRGRVFLDHRDITTLAMHKRAICGISYLPQEPSVFRKLSVADNIRVALEARDYKNKSALERELGELLEEFHLEPVRSSLGRSLSGGERRRVEIARALAFRPSFMLFDEPFAGIDPIFVTEIRNIMQHLRDRGLGLLITDHNVSETLQACDRSYIVHHGKIVAAGTSLEVMANEGARKVYLGEGFDRQGRPVGFL